MIKWTNQVAFKAKDFVELHGDSPAEGSTSSAALRSVNSTLVALRRLGTEPASATRKRTASAMLTPAALPSRAFSL